MSIPLECRSTIFPRAFKESEKRMKDVIDNSNATLEWLDSLKSDRTRREYRDPWQIWLDYCAVRGIARVEARKS